MPVIDQDGSDFIPHFWWRGKKLKLYIHDNGDGTYKLSTDITDADTFDNKDDSWTLLNAARAWFDTL